MRQVAAVVFTLIVSIHALSMDTLQVGYTQSAPFLFETDGQPTGPSMWLLDKIGEDNDLYFELKAYSLEDLLSGLEAGKIHLSASPLTITSERFQQIAFSPPYFISHSDILTQDLKAWQRFLDFLRSFFSVNFYRAVGGLSIIILIFGTLEWFFERKHNKEEFSPGVKGLWEGFWWSAVTMTTVGYGDKSPKTVGGRIVALIWMFTAIIIISGFTAGIASSLTINQIGSSSNAIEDFKEKNLGTIKNSSTDQWLKNNYYNTKTTFADSEEMLRALEEGKIVGIAYDRPILEELARSTSTPLHLLGLKFNPQHYAMGFSRQLNDSIQDRISQSILNHTESSDWKVVLAEEGIE